LKSNVSDYLEMVHSIYLDACAMCPADVSDLRDLKTIRSRVEHEGLSFLTITLPMFAKGFELALAHGKFDSSWKSTHFRGFRFRGPIPAFLQGMVSQLFDRETGRIYDDTIIVKLAQVVDSVRQICLTFKKLELSCSPNRVQEAFDNFANIERSLSESIIPDEDAKRFRLVSSVLWDNDVYRLRDCVLLPKHGPGATADRIAGNGKYVHRSWYERLDNYFPLFETAYVSSAFQSEEVEHVTLLTKDQEYPVRVTPVPKTLKGPRIIAIEPVCMQYAQQALRSIIYDMIENSVMAAGHVNFRDQSVNQRLALNSSISGQLATIDLSDASDRVPRDLALDMFRAYPDFQGAIDACRSTSAILPDGRLISPLRKFASMGSALCFPIESMYFYTICVAALLEFHNLPVSSTNVFTVSRTVHVYGDDIIVPSDAAGIVLDYLQKYNCKVNSSKTFYSGMFRESCGTDAFAGTRVTPVYVRQVPPENKQHVQSLLSWSSTGNQFFRKGYIRTAEFLHQRCEKILRIYPEVSENSAGLGRNYRLGSVRPRKRFNRKFHAPEIRAWIPSPVYRIDKLSGYAALTKSLLKLASRKTSSDIRNVLRDVDLTSFTFVIEEDPRHLERSALYGAVALKLRWVRP